jgi:integrase
MVGTFDYGRYFPNSKLVAHFAGNTVTTPTTSTPTRSAAAAPLGGPRVLSPAIQTPRFRDFAKEWYAQHEIEWRRSYRPTVQGVLDQHLLPRFGEMDVSHIMKEDILNFRSALGKVRGRKSKDGLSAQRINHVTGFLRRVLEGAAERLHFINPYQRIKPLKLSKSDVQPFTMTEVLPLLHTVRKDFENYLKVRFFTGMRTGEVDGLKWRYVDFDVV